MIYEKANQKEMENKNMLLRVQKNSNDKNTLEMLNIKRRERNGNFNL